MIIGSGGRWVGGRWVGELVVGWSVICGRWSVVGRFNKTHNFVSKELNNLDEFSY